MRALLLVVIFGGLFFASCSPRAGLKANSGDGGNLATDAAELDAFVLDSFGADERGDILRDASSDAHSDAAELLDSRDGLDRIENIDAVVVRDAAQRTDIQETQDSASFPDTLVLPDHNLPDVSPPDRYGTDTSVLVFSECFEVHDSSDQIYYDDCYAYCRAVGGECSTVCMSESDTQVRGGHGFSNMSSCEQFSNTGYPGSGTFQSMCCGINFDSLPGGLPMAAVCCCGY